MPFFTKRDPWPGVIEKASTSIVMLVTQVVRPWEGAVPNPSVYSGFVVDKKLGIILTSRSAVTTGPITGKATFLDGEETSVTPLYVDPEHDFGFFKFDPKSIEYMPVTELSLHPEGARVGVDVRVVGSDAGEKLMVLEGTISDCRRMAPDLSDNETSAYTDLNIFYMTSSCGVSDGSAGAPVLDSHGRVIALNAGGYEDAATSFFLPLHRVVRALNLLRKDLYGNIPRGTIQTVFIYQPMDEVRRLGLPSEEESLLRKVAKQTSVMMDGGAGALVVARANVGGPGQEAGLRTGDVLVRVNGKPVIDFLSLEELLDDCLVSASKELHLELYRGSSSVPAKVRVEDMAATTLPKEFIEYSGGVIHPLGYQLAFFSEVPVNSVYVSGSGYSLTNARVVGGSIITEIDGVPIANLDDFERVVCAQHDGAEVPIKYFLLGRKHVQLVSVMTIDRKWWRMRRARRERDGSWTYVDCPVAPSNTVPDNRRPSLLQGRQVSFKHLTTFLGGGGGTQALTESKDDDDDAEVEVAGPKEGVTSVSMKERVLKSLVWIKFSAPFRIDGMETSTFAGCGIVLDTVRGLVWADRSTAASLLGDCKMVVASSFEVDCKVVFLHPMANFAILQYDPTLLGGTELYSLELFSPTRSEDPELNRGDQLDFFGYTRQKRYHVVNGMRVTALERGSCSPSGTLHFSPRNFDMVEFDRQLTTAVGGVYVDSQGRCRCFLSAVGYSATSIAMLCPLAAPVKDALQRVQRAIDHGLDEVPPLHVLGIEFDFVQLSEARQTFGLPEDMARLVSNAADEDFTGAAHGTREILSVSDVLAGTQPRSLLKNGDLIVSLDGKPIVSFSECNRVAEEAGDAGRMVKLTVWRDRAVQEVEFNPVAMSCTGTKRVIMFAGAQVQEMHAHVAFSGFVPSFVTPTVRPGVYISGVGRGSPANIAGISAMTWVAEIDSKPVRELDDVLDALRTCQHGDFVRIKVMTLSGEEGVLTVEMDFKYWETTDLRYNVKDKSWSLRTLSAGGLDSGE